MTDKQIKDGIDVSQCECYSVEDNSCNDTLSGSCIKEKCQTFRLLQTIKAKEQECETLASQLDFEVQKKECLEQECEELKKDKFFLEREVMQFDKDVKELNYFAIKLKNCLTEIKEIAITGLEGFCPKCSRKECEDNNCIETAIRDILQKISECEGK